MCNFGITFENQRQVISDILATLCFEHLSSYIKKSTNPAELHAYAKVAEQIAKKRKYHDVIEELDFVGLI